MSFALTLPRLLQKNWLPARAQMRKQLDESANAMKTLLTYRVKTDLSFLGRAHIGVRHGSLKLLDLTLSRLCRSGRV
jgi:hypothetical protein